MPKTTRGWWRDYFHDHPQLSAKHSDASVGGKAKVYCKKCFDYDLAAMQRKDQAEVVSGQRDHVREIQQIEIAREQQSMDSHSHP
jgi:hypothetical protein